MIRIDLDRAAARRLLCSLVAVATTERPLTPLRAALLKSLGEQLGLGDKDVTAATTSKRAVAAESRSEAEATYMAAVALLGKSGPATKGEKAALAELGATLDLGVATAELARLAAEPGALDGLAPKAPADAKAGKADSERRGKAVKTEDSGTRRKKAGEDSEARRRGAKVDDSETRRRLKGGASAKRDETAPAGDAEAARPRGGKARPLPAFAIPAAIGAVCLVLVVVLLAISSRPAPSVAVGPSTLRADYGALVERWNAALKAHQEVPYSVMTELREQARKVKERATVGAEADPAIGVDVEAFLAGDLAREWERAIGALRVEVEDTMQLAAQEARFDEAEARLASLPAELKGGAWARDRKAELAAWRAYTNEVKQFLGASPSGLAELRRAHTILGRAGAGRLTRAYSDLTGWFRTQTGHSDAVCVAAFDHHGKGDAAEAKVYFEVLTMIEADFSAFLRKKTPEEQERLIAAIAGVLPGGLGAPPPAAGGRGTGFYIAPTLVLTNAHVVGASATVRVETAGGATDGKVLAKEVALDLALIEVPLKGRPLELALDSIHGSARVFAYGYGALGDSDASPLLVTQGAISAVDGEEPIIFDARVNPGNSGGPLVDADGRWVGVVMAKTRSSRANVDSMSLAANGRAAARWLGEVGVTPVLATGAARGQAPPDADVRRSVVRVVVGG